MDLACRSGEDFILFISISAFFFFKHLFVVFALQWLCSSMQTVHHPAVSPIEGYPLDDEPPLPPIDLICGCEVSGMLNNPGIHNDPDGLICSITPLIPRLLTP